MKKKKISLLTLTAFCIGDTIGCGIFATLPEGINRIGSGVIYAWLAAILLTVFVSIPSLIPSTVLPCPSSSYTLPSRLISPYIGYLEIVSIINYVTILAFLGTFFGTYLEMVFPGVPTKAVSIGIILVLWFVNLFGVEAGTKLQKLIVLVLIAAFLAYILTGGRQIMSENLIRSNIFSAGNMKFGAFAVVVALFYNCLGGCFTQCLVLSDEVRKPEKNLLRAGCITAVFVGALFCVMSIVSYGYSGTAGQIDSLGTIAKSFMPGGLWYFFIIGGAWCAMLSTMNAVILSVGYRLDTMSQDGIFPKFFNKTCRFGTKPVCITIPVIVAIVITSLDIPLFSLMAVNSVMCIIASVLRLMPVLSLIRKYPHSYRRAAVKIPPKACCVWVLAAAVVCIMVSISTIMSTSGVIWLATLGILCVLYLYFILRVRYLKAKGYDLLKTMSEPYPEWEQKESQYLMEDRRQAASPKKARARYTTEWKLERNEVVHGEAES